MASKRIMTEEAGLKIAKMLGVIAGEKLEDNPSLEQIHRIVQQGLAPEVFSIGDQLIIPWKDGENEYTVPFDIVSFDDVELSDGEVVPGMTLQWHYCTPFGVQFDGNEAFYVCPDGLPVGTYYFTMGNNWGSNVVNGKTYYFTLTQAVPAGGQLQLGTATSETSGLPDTGPANWRVRVYTSAATKDPSEVLPLTEGSNGTSLGILSSSTRYAETGMNNMHRSAYGYNRWSQSGIRQYLNSSAAKEHWWTAQNPYDRAPAEHWTKDGFLRGFNADFLACLKPVKIVTALNTVSDLDIGTTETTYDIFYLASKRNENLREQLADVEGNIWDYWVRATGGEKPADSTSGAAPITYAIENNAAAQIVRLRSANRGLASSAWRVNSNGTVNGNGATAAHRFAPACTIC